MNFSHVILVAGTSSLLVLGFEACTLFNTPPNTPPAVNGCAVTILSFSKACLCLHNTSSSGISSIFKYLLSNEGANPKDSITFSASATAFTEGSLCALIYLEGSIIALNLFITSAVDIPSFKLYINSPTTVFFIRAAPEGALEASNTNKLCLLTVPFIFLRHTFMPLNH